MTLRPEALTEAASCIGAARRLVVFTGAGVSAESGIPTFRDDAGFWQRFPPEQFARWDGLLATAFLRPGEMAEFVHAVIAPIARAHPSPAHQAIAALDSVLETRVVTQNVDGLHQEAGSRTVREIHGSFFRVVTLRGRNLREMTKATLERMAERLLHTQHGWFRLPRLVWNVRPMLGLGPRGIHRPALVLFGEGMAQPDWDMAQADARACEVMLVVGTSANVWPAAELPTWARQQGAKIITVDPSEPGRGHIWLPGKAGEVLPLLVDAVNGR
jgi:NAD-dependent deacetylase